MLSLKLRSYKKELLDGDQIPFADIAQNMRELNRINTWLGGHNVTIQGVQRLMRNKQGAFSICEIGCGGGDNLYAISKWAGSDSQLDFMGIDIKKECIDFARKQYPQLQAKWIRADYADVRFKVKPDVIFSSLFCHHFDEAELVTMLQWMQQHGTCGFFINDLHRNTIAYYAIQWVTRFFSRSYLVKNDAPLSVARGFTKKEWKNILAAAGIKQYTLRWKWAFRHLIIYKNEA